LDRIGIGFVAHMPLTGEVRRVAVFLEKFGDRRRLLPDVVLVTRGNYDRERRADRNTPGHERGAAGGATRLAVPAGENGALLGDAIDIWCGMAEARASSRIAAEIIPTGVIGHQHDDVGFLVLRLQGSACADERSRSCQNGQTVTDYFWSMFHSFFGVC